MKAAAFSYIRPDSLQQAIAQYDIGKSGPDVRLIAGGQSLGPMLNLRLAEPALVVDIRSLAPLRGHRLESGRLVIGAAVTHAEIEDGLLPDTSHGMLPAIARNIAYRAVRNRGTLGGSLAHADPAADWVNSLMALGARIHVAGPAGQRMIEAEALLVGAYQTSLAAGEIITSVELPAFSRLMRWGYYKICAKVGEFATAIGAVVIDPELGLQRLLIGAVESRPLLVPELLPVLELDYESARNTISEHLALALPQADEVFVHQHAVALARAIDQMKNRS